VLSHSSCRLVSCPISAGREVIPRSERSRTRSIPSSGYSLNCFSLIITTTGGEHQGHQQCQEESLHKRVKVLGQESVLIGGG